MQTDPMLEWQRLAEHYRGLCDEELCELALDMNDLRETAQQALRQELQNRNIADPEAALRKLNEPANRAEPGFNPESDDAPEGEPIPTHEFTWKTELCDCEDREHAWQLSEVLRRAGIESWVGGPGTNSRYAGMSLGGPRLLVAADQLEEARAIVAQPIPAEIIELSRADVPEYEPPVCPKCGAEDPILENAEPVNEWLCEACGAEWADHAPDTDQPPEKA